MQTTNLGRGGFRTCLTSTVRWKPQFGVDCHDAAGRFAENLASCFPLPVLEAETDGWQGVCGPPGGWRGDIGGGGEAGIMVR